MAKAACMQAMFSDQMSLTDRTKSKEKARQLDWFYYVMILDGIVKTITTATTLTLGISIRKLLL